MITGHMLDMLSLRQVRWEGPDFDWLVEHGFDPEPTWTERRTFE